MEGRTERGTAFHVNAAADWKGRSPIIIYIQRLVATLSGYNIPVVIQAHSAWSSLRGSVQSVLAMVSAATGEETASFA